MANSNKAKCVRMSLQNVQHEKCETRSEKCATRSTKQMCNIKKNVRDGENSHPYGPVNLFRYSGISPNSTVDLQHLTDERLTKTNVT